MLKRVMLGAAAGAVATLPQSLIVWGFKAAGIYHQEPPPERISEDLNKPVLDLRTMSKPVRSSVILAEHVAFGAAGGAAFGLTTGVIRPTTVAGLLAGLAIWKASYDGWIPALGIMPESQKDESGRALTMVAAHVVYGLALGALLDRWTRRE